MKTWIVKLVVALVVIAAAVDIVHDFIANDTVHYFATQPWQWLTVAVIGIIGGLAVMLFDRLSSRQKRGVKLLALGLMGGVLSYFAGCFVLLLFRFPSDVLPPGLNCIFGGIVACLVGGIAILCMVFRQVFNSSIK
jgi:uncharacterized membrane-anchored protein